MKYEYDVIETEAEFEPIEAESMEFAIDKIKGILEKTSVWSYGSEPFESKVRIWDSAEPEYTYVFFAHCCHIQR